MTDKQDRKVIRPEALSAQQAARMLGVPIEWVEADLAAGALRNPDGTLNLVHYAAWLNLMARTDGQDA
jgi:hypothetical protein